MVRGFGRAAFNGVVAALLLSTAPIAQVFAQSMDSADRGALGEVNATLRLLAVPVTAAQPVLFVTAPPAAPPPAKPAPTPPKTAAKHPEPAHPDKKLAGGHHQEPAKKAVAAIKKPAPAEQIAAHEPKKSETAPVVAQTSPTPRATTPTNPAVTTATRVAPPPSPAAPPVQLAKVAEPSAAPRVAPPPSPAAPPVQLAKVAEPPAAPQVAGTQVTAIPVSLTQSPVTSAPVTRAPVTPAPVTPAINKPAVEAPPAAAAQRPAPQPQDSKAPAAFVANFLSDAFHIARLSGASSLQRRAQLAELFSGKMDVKRIAGYTTAEELSGKSADIQQRFRTILVSYLVETYYPQLELASDPSIKVETTAAEPLQDGTAVVWTTFTKDGWGSQSVKWHIQYEDGGYRIVDIFSAGASLVQMERDTFRSVMRDGGFNELMAKLDARTKELASAATE